MFIFLKLFSKLYHLPREIFFKFTHNITEHFNDKLILILLSLSPAKWNFPHERKSIVSVVCHRDVASYLMMVKSLSFASRRNFDYYAIDDGSLTKIDKKIICSHNQIRLISLHKNQAGCSFEMGWQNSKYFGLKKLFPRKQQLYYIDSDIIFFRYPKDFIDCETGITYMEDFCSRYSFSACELSSYLGKHPVEKLNTGMFTISSSLISMHIVRELIRLRKTILHTRHVEDHYLEQTAYALLFDELRQKGNKVKKLSKEYFLLAKHKFQNQPVPHQVICIHYVTLFASDRHVDTLKYLAKTHLFQSL